MWYYRLPEKEIKNIKISISIILITILIGCIISLSFQIDIVSAVSAIESDIECRGSEKTSDDLSDSEDARELNKKGKKHVMLGEYDEAMKYFDKALDEDPNSAVILYNKGTILGELGDYEEALAYFDKALDEDPNYASALYNIGTILVKLGDFEEALAYFDKALDEDPNYAKALYKKGAALTALGDYEEALAYFDKALEISPNCENALNLKLLAQEQINPGNQISETIPTKQLTTETNSVTSPYSQFEQENQQQEQQQQQPLTSFQQQQQQQFGNSQDKTSKSTKCPPSKNHYILRYTNYASSSVDEILTAIDGSIQLIEKSGAPIKYDEYRVVIDRMPPGLTPEAYLREMALDMNKAIDNVDFDNVNEFHKVVIGEPHVGSLYNIDIFGDDGSVILVDMTSSSFTFQTITTKADGSHPENGIRQFGFERNNDGSVTFYTRGVSQADWGWTDSLGKKAQQKGWTSAMIGISNKMNKLGGVSNPSSIVGGQICQEDTKSENKKKAVEAYCTVSITSKGFTPKSVACESITWKNEDKTIHTVTSLPNSLPNIDSGIIAPGGTYEYKFEAPGEFGYYCTLHPGKQGTASGHPGMKGPASGY